jgi:hypothetical protein
MMLSTRDEQNKAFHNNLWNFFQSRGVSKKGDGEQTLEQIKLFNKFGRSGKGRWIR